MKLSDVKCRKATALEKLIKLSDGDGLFLHVDPNGKKLWRMSYRHAGKQRDMAFGPYPMVSLLEAREKRYAARRLLLDGKDPAAEKKAEETAAAQREETTFAAYADMSSTASPRPDDRNLRSRNPDGLSRSLRRTSGPRNSRTSRHATCFACFVWSRPKATAKQRAGCAGCCPAYFVSL